MGEDTDVLAISSVTLVCLSRRPLSARAQSSGEQSGQRCRLLYSLAMDGCLGREVKKEAG